MPENSGLAIESLPAAQKVALGYAPLRVRPVYAAMFALDVHCAHLLRRASEPMLAQMRLTWWREALGRPADERARGSPLLASLSAWAGEEDALAGLVAGWEYLIGASPLPITDLERFASHRADAFAGLARLLDRGAMAHAARAAGFRWALADLAQGLSDPAERAGVVELAAQTGTAPIRLSANLRPVAVLDGLARRAIARGGAPLLADRISALAALRIGMLGH